jgi:ABC-type branched-subunit amino acid transport system ATPase component
MLNIRNLSGGYGRFKVLHEINLAVPDAAIVGLVGHNGAGKSTLLKAIFGMVPACGGSVMLDGTDRTRAQPFEKAELGIRYVPQEGNVFPGLTIEDNLRLGAHKLPGGAAQVSARIAEIYAIFPILRERQQSPARVLSGGERQMLAMSIALMTSPKLLLLDEPSAGLAPILVDRLFDMIHDIPARLGASVLLVEQNVNQALRVASEVYVLEEGRVVFHGPSSEKEQIVRHLWRLGPEGQGGGIAPAQGHAMPPGGELAQGVMA